MAFGVPAGANIPNQAICSAAGSPASATVGTSGSAGMRFGVVTAITRTRPSFTIGTAAGAANTKKCVHF